MTARSSATSNAELDETRYEFVRKLGEGGAGSVFLVRDRETGEQLALKKLFRMDPKSVLRLKREFRALQAVNHPHVVKLYDMGQGSDAWFLTMEYLEGVDLSSYLDVERSAVADVGDVASSQRFVSVFRQLAEGIQALHAAGLLHRDLKPSNVLVVDRRVVVLDFGLVRELGGSASTLTEDGSVAGTPAYMAPEQLRAETLSTACDWYAFGVMLYEAASSHLPIDGSLITLLRAKLDSDPLPLVQVAEGVPSWLNDLCMALLRRDAAQRPTGPEIIAKLDAALPLPAAAPPAANENVVSTEADAQLAPAIVCGRDAEQRQLWAALAQAETGGAVAVHVRGASGAGKSALLDHFFDQIELRDSVPGRAGTLVLRSRCYELEAMPFKALDGMIDALVRHLARLDDVSVAHVLPANSNALMRVFPVFERLNVVQRLGIHPAPEHDAVQLLGRAETALRMLLDNLAARCPVVVWVDDLQWGDLDSARIIRSWLLQPSAAALMFVFSYRADEVITSTCLSKLLAVDPERPSRATEYTIDIKALGPEDIRALCEARLSLELAEREAVIARVVHESQGSPFLASQLLALAQAMHVRGDSDLQALSLDAMVAHTSGLLMQEAKIALAFLAVAGRPMPPKLLLRAAGIKRGGRALVHELRTLNLVRTRDVAGERMLETYHDRIRERVLGSLSSAQHEHICENLLRALEDSGVDDPDWLLSLALVAGQHALALQHGRAAAARASDGLAFERAAGLYRACLDLVADADSCELWQMLSLSLVRCGRGAEAADAALECAKRVPASQHIAWLARAATHFLRSGRFAQGEALVSAVLEARKIDVPSSDAGLMAAIVWERIRIKLQGTQDKMRPIDQIPSELLERFDTLDALFATQSYHPLRAALFQARALRTALEAGEPRRLVAALSSASTGAALFGTAQAARESDALLARAAAVNARLAVPDHKSLCVARAINAFMLGRTHEVLEPADEAERLFRNDAQEDADGNYFERLLVRSVCLGARYAQGEIAAFARDLRQLLDEAAAAANQLSLLQLTYNQTLAEQIEGRGSLSRQRLLRQQQELPDNCFGSLHVLHMTAVMCDANWTADYSLADELLAHAWPRFLRSSVRQASFMAAMAFTQHITLVVNQLLTRGNTADAARAVQPDLRGLAAVPLEYAQAYALAMRGRIAFLNARPSEAKQQLLAAEELHERTGAWHFAARTRYALGAVVGGEQGVQMRAEAILRLQTLGFVDPVAEMHAGYPELIGPHST